MRGRFSRRLVLSVRDKNILKKKRAYAMDMNQQFICLGSLDNPGARCI